MKKGEMTSYERIMTAFEGGKPDRVIEESKKAIASAGRDGAFILASGCMIPDAAPKENLEALIQVAKETRY